MNTSRILTKKTANILGLAFAFLSVYGILSIALTGGEPQRLIETASQLDNRVLVLVSFVCLALISQFLVIPSGSILMVGGGFLLGTLPATFIYAVLLPITGFIVGEIAASSSLKKWVDNLLNKFNKAATVIDLLRHEPFTLSVVLRLTPVVPAAIAAIVASTLKINHTTFIFATLCVGWMRPLFFASIGGAAQSIVQIQQDSTNIADVSILPLLLLALSAMLNLLIRCWLRWRRGTTTE